MTRKIYRITPLLGLAAIVFPCSWSEPGARIGAETKHAA